MTLGSIIWLVGCAGGKETAKESEFFTSGSREADQRASQRMARDKQIEASATKEPEKETSSAGDTVERKLTLFERLGGEPGIAKIMDDFIPRIIQDPRVNWERKGVERGGFSFSRNKAVTHWQPSPQNVAILKRHMGQFIALATGGPTRYEGKEMKSAHAALRITNSEFDASIGDLKATLDRLQIADQEQKELLAVMESTRPQVVTER